MRLFNENAAYSQLGLVIDDQLFYNAQPRYNLSSEILRTKIMPDEIIANGRIVTPTEKPPLNWGPLAIAAATIFFATQ